MARFLLLQNYGPCEGCTEPMSDWAPEDIRAHLSRRGESHDERP
jgi:hypothetical protein